MEETQELAFLMGKLNGYLSNKDTVEWLNKNGVSNEQIDELTESLMKVSQAFYFKQNNESGGQ